MSMRRIWSLFLVLVLLITGGSLVYAAVLPAVSQAPAAPGASTYYVANGGNDSGPGTDVAPWARCPGMPGWTGTHVLQPGDVVYFDSGGTWSAGSGEAAVIPVVGGVTYDGSSWGSGTRATLRATGALWRSVVFIEHDDPTEETVVRGFHIDVNDQTTTGVGVNWPGASGSLTGATKRIEDCVIHDVHSRSGDGTYEYGIVVSAGWSEGQFHVSNVEVLDCEVYNISRGAINIYAPNDHPASTISNVLVRGNDVYATGTDPSYAGSAMAAKNHIIDVVFEYNHIHDPIRGPGFGVSTHTAGFTGPEGLVFRYNIIDNSPHTGIYVQSPGDKSMAIYGNLIMNSAYGGMVLSGSLDDLLSARIYNNTFYHNGIEPWTYEVCFYENDATISTLEFSNNIVVPSSAVANTRCLLDGEGNITAHTHNLFYRAAAGNLVYDSGTWYTAANIASWEPAALAGDPLLVNPANLPTGFSGVFGTDLRPNTDGLSLSSDSPAKDAGATLGGSYAGSINSVARPGGPAWDIGAYELEPSLMLTGLPGDQMVHLSWRPTHPLSPTTTTWWIDYYTTTLTAPFTATDPLSTTRTHTLTGLSNYQLYTVTLHAMTGSSSYLSDTVRVMPTDLFVHLPLVLRSD